MEPSYYTRMPTKTCFRRRWLTLACVILSVTLGLTSAADANYAKEDRSGLPAPYMVDPVVLPSDPWTQTRSKRDVAATRHQTQHLRPAKNISPITNHLEVSMPPLPPKEVAQTVAKAAATIQQRFDTIEPALAANGRARLEPATAAWFMAASHKTKIVAKNISRIALIAEEATKIIGTGHHLTPSQVTYGLPTSDIRGTVLSTQCPLEVDFPCQPRKYRAYNGYCNNVQNPRWGNANTRYLRFLPPVYADGVSVPRGGAANLPLPRLVSNRVHTDVTATSANKTHAHLTAMTALWGEYVWHDVSHTPQMAGYQGQRLRCCNLNPSETHPECFPIVTNASFFEPQNAFCQEYVRSGTAPRVGCTLGPREQINQVTSFLDASAIYGASSEEADDLRLFRGGLLKTQSGPNNSRKGLLPPSNITVDCNVGTGRVPSLACFDGGDVRINEHVELTSLHLLLVREHNRLATELTLLNPHWADEMLFQEARRILAAEVQHVTYNEFLPVVLGKEMMDKYGLEPESSGYFTGYDININAGVANGVAAAALRFVTSLMPAQLSSGTKSVPKSSFYAPFALYTPGAFDQILDGLLRTQAQQEDPFMNNLIDGNPGVKGQFDMAAHIIQHGRDHGVPDYNQWRAFCGLPKVTAFAGLSDVMTTPSIAALQGVYRTVDDIDLFTGGLAEKPLDGAVVGPTLGCLLARQFHYLRRGDRYWYENELPPSSFTKEQLHNLRKVTLARLICDNSDGLNLLQPRVFLKTDPFLNAEVSCNDDVLARLNLKPWKTASPNFVVPPHLLEDSVTRARREAADVMMQEEDLFTEEDFEVPILPPLVRSAHSRTSPLLSLMAAHPQWLPFLRPLIYPESSQSDSEVPHSSAPKVKRQPSPYPALPPAATAYDLEYELEQLLGPDDFDDEDESDDVMGDNVSSQSAPRLPASRLSQDWLEDSFLRGHEAADLLHDFEVDLVAQRRVADPKSPAGTSFSFSRPKRQATLIANISRVLQFASKRFVNSFLGGQKDSESGGRQPHSLQDIVNVLPNIDVSEVVDIPKIFQCDEQTLPCDHTSLFRTMTGWCNNLQQPELGKSFRAFVRLLPPRYEDGLLAMRQTAKSGRPLPTARLVSSNIHSDISAPHVRYSLVLMQFGQILDHDITFTPVNRGFGGSILDCSACDAARTVHPECAPISVPPNDPWYPQIDRETGRPKCIAFTRSLPGQLTLGFREQLNQVTAFLDASHTYGSDVCEGRTLRSFIGGGLNATRHPIRGKELLPQTAEHKECKSPSGVCFTGGDTRASEQAGLAAFHTLFMREHNRIVEQLAAINPHWSDEMLYQHGRRIMSAEFQHMTYNEFLPRVLGWNAVTLYDLRVQTDGYYNGYDSTCNPTVFNEFGAAAFRFGHSLLKSNLKRMGRNYEDRGSGVQLRDVFMNPDMLYEPGMIDEILRGLLGTSMETLDQFITHEVTNHLFEDKKRPFSGMDLASLNIQRARDHGIPPYNEYRALCNLKRAQTWDDLSREMRPEVIARLRATYESVDDIDLFPGGLSETSLHGGLVGPTFACIIAMQFRQLRKCDRFWYENGDPLVRFTEQQLSEIRKSTVAKLICDNSDDISALQRSAFDQPEPFLNPRVPCSALPAIDLELWKERVSCTVGNTHIEIGKAELISPCVMCTCTKEGPICQSLKISNCFQLAQAFSKEKILQDHVCKVQCAFAFRAFPQVGAPSDVNALGFS